MLKPETQFQKFNALLSPVFQEGLLYQDIYKRYAKDDLGIHHATQRLRFKPYDYERPQKLTDLGDDVHPLAHMLHTHDAVLSHVLYQQIGSGNHKDLSIKGIKTLRLTALLHDVGENTSDTILEECGVTVDDIPFHEKIHEDELNEAKIREYIYGKLFADVADKTLNEMEDIVLQSDTTNYETGLFRATENLGYYETGIKAAVIINNNLESFNNGTALSDQRLLQLGRMGLLVTNYWKPVLEEKSKEFPRIGIVLSKTKPILDFTNSQVMQHLVVA